VTSARGSKVIAGRIYDAAIASIAGLLPKYRDHHQKFRTG